MDKKDKRELEDKAYDAILNIYLLVSSLLLANLVLLLTF